MTTTMTGREDSADEKPKVKILTPSFGIDKARLNASGFRSKGFAITDLLGLESELQPHQTGPGSGGNSEGPSPGMGGFSFAGGSLPLGLGFLCSLAAQQPPGAPCFLPSHIPLLQSRTESHFMQNLEQQRDAYSGTYQSHLWFYALWFTMWFTTRSCPVVLKSASASSQIRTQQIYLGEISVFGVQDFLKKRFEQCVKMSEIWGRKLYFTTFE